jgi:hypothetical protein
MADKIWLVPPWGVGEPQEVDATPEVLVPMLVAGWSQCAPPEMKEEEVETNVHG